MELNLKNKVLEALKNDYNQKIINSNDFYFLKAQEALHHFLEIKLNNETEEYLITHKKNYDELKQLFEDSEELNEFGKAIFTLISYCDLKAYKKNDFNLYDDKRVLALAFVRMNNWVEQLLTYKFQNQLSEGSIKNAIDYLLNPSDNFTMLSENHRNQISDNLFKKGYNKDTFKEDFINFFSELSINVKNPLNYTHLLTRISYDISFEWKESLVGIMASDSTGWLENYVMHEDYDVFWNSKRPSGTDKTIKLLKECISENGHFKLFYTSYYNVNYIAEVIDVVESEREYIKADWNTNYSRSSIYPNFQELADNNKNAKIVFLINKFYKVEPISHNQFKIYKSFKFPTQDNLTPIESYITNSENIKKQIMSREIDILEYKKQIILQGPPGTGKTREAKLIAKEILGLNSTDDLKDNEQFKLIQFHPSYTYEDFVRGIVAKPNPDGEGIIYEAENKTLGDFATKALDNFLASKGQLTIDSEFQTRFNTLIDEINSEINSGKIFKFGDKSTAEIISVGNEYLIYSFPERKEIRYKLLFSDIEKVYNKRQEINIPIDLRDKEKELGLQMKGKYPYYFMILKSLEKIELPQNFNLENSDVEEKPYILVIDEINRANLSSVLGELIYALEYRGKAVESMYSVENSILNNKNQLILPDNLYIIGTMNTADRSVGHIDYAIRRRFAFVEVLPEKLEDNDEIFFNTSDFIDVAKLFIKVGEDQVLDFEKAENSDFLSDDFSAKDVALGHSYFIAEKKKISEDNKQEYFNMKMKYEVIPILNEYLKDGVFNEKATVKIKEIEQRFA